MAESKQKKKSSAETSPQKQEKRRIQRSAQDKVIAGVCSGFAEYFNIDANLIRIIWFLSVFLGGFGFFAYILSWIIIPQGAPGSERSEKAAKPKNTSLILGLILVIIGGLFLFRELDWLDFHPFHFHHWNLFWLRDAHLDVLLSLALIAFGIYYLANMSRNDKIKEQKSAESKKSSGGTSMQKRLSRSTKDRMLAGVCGGIAEYFDIDPSLVRIGFVLLALFAGGGVLGVVAYIVMMIIIPEDTAVEAAGSSGKSASTKSKSK